MSGSASAKAPPSAPSANPPKYGLLLLTLSFARILPPLNLAMLRESLPMNRLGRSGGLTGSAIAVAAAFGPLLGAALLGLGSWRYLFLMNIPLVIAGLVCLALLQYQSRGQRKKLSLDWPGAASFAVL